MKHALFEAAFTGHAARRPITAIQSDVDAALEAQLRGAPAEEKWVRKVALGSCVSQLRGAPADGGV